MAAVGDTVYVTTGLAGPVVAIDGATLNLDRLQVHRK